MKFFSNIITPSPYDITKGNKNASRKVFLFHRKSSRCCYCNCKTLLLFSNNWKGNEPKNLATIEHIYYKWDIRRALSKKTDLCCFNCNQKKNKKEQQDLYNGYDYTQVFDIIEETNKINKQ